MNSFMHSRSSAGAAHKDEHGLLMFGGFVLSVLPIRKHARGLHLPRFENRLRLLNALKLELVKCNTEER